MGSFAKETLHFKEPTNRSHPICPRERLHTRTREERKIERTAVREPTVSHQSPTLSLSSDCVCNTLQQTAIHRNTLQQSLQQTLQQTLQHTTTLKYQYHLQSTRVRPSVCDPSVCATHCNTLQHTAPHCTTNCNTHCNTRCNTLQHNNTSTTLEPPESNPLFLVRFHRVEKHCSVQ